MIEDDLIMLKILEMEVSNLTIPPAEFVLEEMDTFWLLFSGVLVFFMQAGFSLLEAGSVREKNVNNILYKNLMDASIGAICFWLIGFGLAYGGSNDGKFIGEDNFGLSLESNKSSGYINFFFQWAFAATAATIVSGAVAERTKISAYFCYSCFLSTFVYPVVVHWIWDGEGFLSGKLIDFAGSGVVHMVGGFSALWGAYFVGPRLGRFEEYTKEKRKREIIDHFGSSHNVYEMKGHSDLLAALGVSILWVGWYGFNCGSTLAINGSGHLVGKIAITTTIAAASGAVTVTLIQYYRFRTWDLLSSLNGVLAGLVGITAGCAAVELWCAFLIGIIAGLILLVASTFLKYIKIDDPLDAFPVHGACGAWGVLAAGIFTTKDAATFGGYDRNDQIDSGMQFATQFLGVVCIAVWTSITSSVCFYVIDNLLGGLRVDDLDN